MKKRIVIIGSGFGGVYTARHLKPLVESGEADVTIINRTNYFLFTPLLHEVATGGLSHQSVVEPIREIFRHSNIHFVQDEVKFIDPVKKEVITFSKDSALYSPLDQTGIYPYDYLVISSGADTNYYGIQGAQENCLTLKNLDDALKIRKHILTSCARAAEISDMDARKHLLSCVIVGAGPTGVELAAELQEFMHDTLCEYYKLCGFEKSQMKISLVAASPDVLSMFPPKLRAISQKELEKKGVHVMLNMKVTCVEAEKIFFGDGTFIQAHTIIWVAGVKPAPMELDGAEKEKSGRIKVDEFLRVVGKDPVSNKPYNSIFALGDVSGTAPMLAQVAVQQGKTVAQNIAFSMSGSPLVPFIFKEKGVLVSLGQWYAAGKIYGVTLKGPIMWWIWRTVYLFNFQSWRKRLKIAAEWTTGLFYPRDITQL